MDWHQRNCPRDLATAAGRAQSKPKAIALMMTKPSSSTIAMDAPVVFDALTSDEEFAAALEELSKLSFGFGAISTNPNLPIWHGAIDKQSLPVRLAVNALSTLTDAEFELISCHLNLQTHGLDGAFHVDDGDPNGDVTHALNWYVHPYPWPAEYGGYLLVGDDTRNLRAILPARNSAVLIPANILHCATSPFLAAGAAARISLTLKLRLKDEI